MSVFEFFFLKKEKLKKMEKMFSFTFYFRRENERNTMITRRKKFIFYKIFSLSFDDGHEKIIESKSHMEKNDRHDMLGITQVHDPKATLKYTIS